MTPPSPFVERRTAYRRADDRGLHDERVFLARLLDLTARQAPAEARVAAMLALVASTAHAQRSAVVTEAPDGARRVISLQLEGEDPAEARALASWLDAAAPRARARRAASGQARISLVTPSVRDAVAPGVSIGATNEQPGPAHYACLPVPGSDDVALGFEFGDAAGAANVATHLPSALARHAAVGLATVTGQLAVDAELAGLRARDGERTRYVSTVAHELRTPLTGLSGYLDLILDGKVDDQDVQRDFLERSRDIVEMMAELVSDLLEQSRIESGTLRLARAPFSVADVGARVVAALQPIAMGRGIELEAVLPPRMRAATGDRRRVEQILTNLVGNALKFSPAGTRVDVGATFVGPLAVVTVRDEGAGIGREDRTRIFERFYRTSGHERITGTGLGLPIARDLARAMGGDLDVASVVDAGSSFVLVLPGPAPVDRETISSQVAASVADEELELETRAVMRAMRAGGVHRLEKRASENSRDGGAPDDSRGAGDVDAAGPPEIEALRAGEGPSTTPSGPRLLASEPGPTSDQPALIDGPAPRRLHVDDEPVSITEHVPPGARRDARDRSGVRLRAIEGSGSRERPTPA